jgi:riboflavin kinase/FMN adenylyltransferase
MPFIVSTAISIGNFDAVHVGHVALIHAARSAVGSDGSVEIWTFEPPPCSILQPEVQIERITTFDIRKALLLEAGANQVVKLEPTPGLLSLEPTAFIEQLVKTGAPDYIVEGAGFRFGHQRTGSIQTLQSLGQQYQFECVEVAGVEISLDGSTNMKKASSSLVRSLIKEGRVQEVAKVLGRYYELSGIVTKGDCRGRELGVPTANLGKVDTMLPRDGIYAGTANVDGTLFIAAISVGTKPTFGSHDRVCEAHLIGFDGEIGQYDWPLTVTLSHWIREQVTFDSIESLTIAIEQDIQSAIELYERA